MAGAGSLLPRIELRYAISTVCLRGYFRHIKVCALRVSVRMNDSQC